MQLSKSFQLLSITPSTSNNERNRVVVKQANFQLLLYKKLDNKQKKSLLKLQIAQCILIDCSRWKKYKTLCETFMRANYCVNDIAAVSGELLLEI